MVGVVMVGGDMDLSDMGGHCIFEVQVLERIKVVLLVGPGLLLVRASFYKNEPDLELLSSCLVM